LKDKLEYCGDVLPLEVIDLFCGAGGLSEGFRQAGFKIALGIDNEKSCIETFNKNFGNRGLLIDIENSIQKKF